jgi:hypothetical protein
MPTLKAPEDAKIAVEAAWHEWKRQRGFQHDDVPSGTVGLEFFLYLKGHHPDLLDFEYQGDKWQIVHSWLLQDSQVKD